MKLEPIEYLRGVMLREQKQAAPRITLPSMRPLDCPCVAIYSHCYCHLRKPAAQNN